MHTETPIIRNKNIARMRTKNMLALLWFLKSLSSGREFYDIDNVSNHILHSKN